MDRPATSRFIRYLAAAALLSAVGCGQAFAPDSDSGKLIATGFLDDLRAGKVEDAWQGASTEFKSLMGLHSLKDLVKRHPALKAPAEFAERRPVELNGRKLAEHVFLGTSKVRGKPVPSTIKVLLGAEHGGLRVEKLSVE